MKEKTRSDAMEIESQIETEKEDYLHFKPRTKESHRVEPGDNPITKL